MSDTENHPSKMASAQQHWVESTTKAGVDPTSDATGSPARPRDTLATDARAAADAEHKMSLMDGIRAYPRAVAWSVVISTATTMDGYDTGFLSSLLGLPAFRQQFGHAQGNGYVISPAWQSAIGNSSSIGIFLGVLLNGWLTDYLGHRRILMSCYVLITALVFIPFFAPSVGVLVAGEILCGIVWGQFSITGATYASEVCPLPLRAYLTSYINITWILGQFIAALVLRGVASLPDTNPWAYRIPFAVQWVWPIPLCLGAYLAPESPWWLVRQGRLDEAEVSLRRLSSKKAAHQVSPHQTMAMMVHTDQLERAYEEGTSYLDCFRGVNLRRTEIACMAWCIQVFFGLPLNGYDTYFFEQAGLDTVYAFDLTVGDRLIALTGTALSWLMLTYFGRRTIYQIGITCNVILLITIGGAASAHNNGGAWAQSILLMCWPFVTSMTVGSVAFAIVSEVGSTRLRAKTIAIARNTWNLLNIIFGVVMPYLINPDAAGLQGKAAFIFVFLGALSLVWVVFRLPETKHRTYEELDILFLRKVKARDFKNTAVAAYQEDIHKAVGQ
ncbi:MFS transporter, SP family, general alpha glucoside:H+ symporter [Sporothrix schenckii 1099-18]|uniref:Major facilitator superfamily (MFS) profile domain-containing protein n=2 Tax=Sporothrix schenckii TaxID=29908 RepID=U7PR57_SPOS1|nr:MFS transporter, SP family, general alpha glucoside:H+ symporter [Sporothrix schenckii 1099-18]ERS98138.1 hypothetical protein HMPREF1624_04918 [Sporothrix schenckii ATCC 58251]KJR89768.1 MFS transporter, SP family, general alpha glucoside:H+ symporter [Sporothrix schenckii 1099-18]